MTESSVTVRQCRKEDVPLLAEREPPSAGVAAKQFERQERGDTAYLVAWVDGEPVGSGELTLAARPELQNLHVDRAYRNRGVGGALITAAEERARSSGVICVGVGDENSDARRLYERLGYAPSGEFTTTTYSYVDEDGTHRTATERDEFLVKPLSR